MYNTPMLYTLATIQETTEYLWEEYTLIFPKLVRFDCPKIILSNRLTSTAGYNKSEENTITLGNKFIAKFPEQMLAETLPHELGHQIDYNINGWHNKRKHHDKLWVAVMEKIGVPYSIYHNYGKMR